MTDRMKALEERVEAAEAADVEQRAGVDRLAGFFDLIGLLSDEASFAAEIEALHQRAAAAKASCAEVAEQRKRLDAASRMTRERLNNEDALLVKRLVAANDEAEKLAVAFKARKQMTAAWTTYAQGDFGAVNPPALVKAKRAHGLPVDWQQDPDVDDAAQPNVQSVFPSRGKRAERPSRRT